MEFGNKDKDCNTKNVNNLRERQIVWGVLTGTPGFPGTERGGMLGLLPGGGGAAAGVGTGLGAAGAAMAGVALRAGDIFKRFNASLKNKKINKWKL